MKAMPNSKRLCLAAAVLVPATVAWADIVVTAPAEGARWNVRQDWKDFYVDWHGAAGRSVYMHLWKDGRNLGEFHARTDNDSHAEVPGPGHSWKPPWGYGDGFRVQVLDYEGNSGFSGEFTVEPASAASLPPGGAPADGAPVARDAEAGESAFSLERYSRLEILLGTVCLMLLFFVGFLLVARPRKAS